MNYNKILVSDYDQWRKSWFDNNPAAGKPSHNFFRKVGDFGDETNLPYMLYWLQYSVKYLDERDNIECINGIRALIKRLNLPGDYEGILVAYEL